MGRKIKNILEYFVVKKFFGIGELLEEFEYRTKTFQESQRRTLNRIIRENRRCFCSNRQS